MIYRTESERHSNTRTPVFNVALFTKAQLQNQLGLCPLPGEQGTTTWPMCYTQWSLLRQKEEQNLAIYKKMIANRNYLIKQIKIQTNVS